MRMSELQNASPHASPRPRPAPDALSKPFWDGVAEGMLVIQRCNACEHYIHPPFPECTACRSSDLGYSRVSGRGAIHQRAIVEAQVVSGFEADVPYACLIVELEEEPGLLVAGNLVGADPYAAVIGRPVTVTFVARPDGVVLPAFELTAEVRS
jgi:uncharacterized protein